MSNKLTIPGTEAAVVEVTVEAVAVGAAVAVEDGRKPQYIRINITSAATISLKK